MGGGPRAGLVRLRANNSVDVAFAPDDAIVADGAISALAYDAAANRLWVGRRAPPFLAVLDGSSGPVALTIPQPNDEVRALLVVGDHVYVGGQFEAFAGSTKHKLVRLSRLNGDSCAVAAAVFDCSLVRRSSRFDGLPAGELVTVVVFSAGPLQIQLADGGPSPP